MRKVVKKLFNGKVDIRSFEIDQCKANEEGLTVVYNSNVMTLTNEELTTKLLEISPLFKNKTKGGRDYHLYSYRWQPDN